MDEIRVAKIDSQTVESYPELMGMIKKFLTEADESDVNVKDTIEMMKQSDVWLGYIGRDLAGYLILKIEYVFGQGKVCLVHQVFIDVIARRSTMMHEIEQAGVNFARENGVKKMFYTTRRNAEAFMRLLKKDWEIDSTIISLCV